MSAVVYLVVSDLDGSLLDHHDYNYEAARPMLQLLEELRIPLVLASSKTRAEMLQLRQEMDNNHPFIVENGAAVFIPEHYFTRAPADCELRAGYYCRELAPPRSTWAAPIADLQARMPGRFTDFSSAGVEGIVAMTGLTPERAALANEREYSEPVQWRGDAQELASFIDTLTAAGARVARGGRFYSVTGDCDKGQAMDWLRGQYALAAAAHAVYDLAIGDGENDVPMLELAHTALQIPAPDRALPKLQRHSGVIVGAGFGPEAWVQGVSEWLRCIYQSPEEV